MKVSHYLAVRTYRHKDEKKCHFRIAFMRTTEDSVAENMLEDLEEIPSIREAETKANNLAYHTGLMVVYDTSIYGELCTRAEAEERRERKKLNDNP